ncbi:kinase-like domain-containing protein, partial [Rhizophagus irregularis DAOM 181602=DAOM 197198]
MDDYLTVKELGNGSFGTVVQAKHNQTGQVVAIKKMKKKFSSWDKVCELREFKALRTLPSHPSIISLLEAFLIPQTRELYFVFEYMEGNLYQLIKDRRGKKLNEKIVQSIIFQILEGLYFIHSYGIFHRDMKPENILISTQKKITCEYDVENDPNTKNNWSDDIDDEFEYMVKVGDFGLAREIKSKPPYTDYVSTRWYRAPEVLLRSNSYSAPIDLWAVGTILAELFTLNPLFPGYSEIDQLYTISKVLGSPNVKSELNVQTDGIGGGEWKEGVKLAKTMGFSFPQTPPQPLSNMFSQSTPPYFLEFLSNLLLYDPKQRLTALDALKHPYFTESNLIFTPLNELEEINLNKRMEKKRKNDSFLFKRGNLSPGDKKNNNRYIWTKATDGHNKDIVELFNSGPASHLRPLDIEAANNVRQEEFVLPTIKAISPFRTSQDNGFGDNMKSIEQSIINNHLVREHGTIMEEYEHEETSSISRPYTAHCNGHGRRSIIDNAKPIPISRGRQGHGFNGDVPSRHKSNLSRSFQFPPVHKRDRSSATSEIDQMIKEIENMNQGIDSSQIDYISPISPKSVDLQRYQLPDDVMRFFGAVDDSSPVLRRSCSRSRDFMKVHRRYSSASATQEMSPTTFDFQHQKKPSVASSQDHTRNDSGFSTNSTNNSSLENEKEIPSYATKVYGQHLKTWQQICQENEISSHDSPLNDDNFGMLINDSFKSPVIPEFRVSDILGNDILSNDISQSKQESPTSANNSFFSNLKAAMKSHAVSPTKRYGIFSSNHESASTSTTQQSTLKLQPRIQRSKSNSGAKETKKAKSAITKKRSFIFDSTSVSANSLFSLKDDNTMKESSSKGTGGEKKDKKLS